MCDEMGSACSTYRRDKEMHTKYWSGNVKGRGHLEDLGIDGRIILEWTLGN
jgi:hypothetical protein